MTSSGPAFVQLLDWGKKEILQKMGHASRHFENHTSYQRDGVGPGASSPRQDTHKGKSILTRVKAWSLGPVLIGLLCVWVGVQGPGCRRLLSLSFGTY
ncbi:hypothetical protein CONLIGDRAFT_113280 [Coniochaeta ligniaria NRRL 30616]|uniref:Uncharacterized protein n=1 Tax=Coniochaeta ligniaria NRRL 30616 TaxID=1408157 RepID=A0A1J7I968_9PEZI|nr:hypothetical protein CONLIGDRAFT_113280 [Coniochaeta ligniaria NRRL 30616]